MTKRVKSKKEKLERFNLEKYKYHQDGTSNILDFKSSASYMKSLGMEKWFTREVSNVDARGYFYTISSDLLHLKRLFRYGGWADTSVYGRRAITYYGL